MRDPFFREMVVVLWPFIIRVLRIKHYIGKKSFYPVVYFHFCICLYYALIMGCMGDYALGGTLQKEKIGFKFMSCVILPFM